MRFETPYARRKNPDSTVDSICANCYQTIATDCNEDILTIAEQCHSCDPNAELDRIAYVRHSTY